MGKRTRLLATVALPIVSLVWQPAQATTMRPVLAEPAARSLVVEVQGRTEDEELLRLKRQRAREIIEEAEGKKRKDERRKADDGERAKEKPAKEKKADEGRRDKDRDTAKEKPAKEKKADEGRRDKDRDTAKDKPAKEKKADESRRGKDRDAVKAEDDRRGKDEAEAKPRRKRDAERERIARDPSKTTRTIDLPFERGAAVLDSDKDADNRRGAAREDTRRKRDEERARAKVRVPRSDADAQVDRDGRQRKPVKYESAARERGERRERRPDFESRGGWQVERHLDGRQVIRADDRVIVRSDDSRRLSRQARETFYEGLPNGRVREVILRPNGDRVVTIRDRYGEIVQRSRIDGSGREYVMFYAPEFDRDSRPTFVDPGTRLPPMRLAVPLDDYIADTSSETPRDYREFLERPPVEEVERVYTLDEVKYSARIRDKVRRIDLDTITFATGSADVSMNQAATLRNVADAINRILDEDPGETFLIEGHTDAVGSDESNLVLSDERAESVADVLTDVYAIPPENLATQGYGERFLKIATDGPEQLNRRVTIRRVTPLVKPVAMAE